MVSLILVSLVLHTSVALRVGEDKAQDVPWAPTDNVKHGYSLTGYRVGVGWDEVHVEKMLSNAGKSGTAYLVRYVKSKEFLGERAVLKVQKEESGGGTRFESVAKEAAFMKKMRTVPHTSQLMGDGYIWVPGSVPLTWVSGGEALLMSIAKGAELKKVLPLDEESMNTVTKDLTEFSDAMVERNFFHGDLTLENVFWDGNECTVIDFGTGQDLTEKPKTRVQMNSRRIKKSARHEMRVFLHLLLETNKKAIAEASPQLAAAKKKDFHDWWRKKNTGGHQVEEEEEDTRLPVPAKRLGEVDDMGWADRSS